MTLSPAVRLPRPAAGTFDSSLWIDEAIWGHRLYSEQTPWLTLLEFLNVFATKHAHGQGLTETPDRLLKYARKRRLHLRNIVFNNPWLPWIKAHTTDDSERWSLWLARMKEHAIGLGDSQSDFSYLQHERFESRDSFEDFASLVDLLRSTAIEGDSNKRWSSKFLFPYGPACLFEDLRVAEDGKASNDRRFFARTGELTYLMLSRSSHRDELREQLAGLLLKPGAVWNRLVDRLQPTAEPEHSAGDGEKSSFLPYEKLRDFDDFSRDLVMLLRTELPGYDVLPHLVDMIGLHLVLYTLRRAAEWVGAERPVLVVEMIAPKRTTVRDLSVETYDRNNRLSSQAVMAFIRTEVEDSPEWALARASTDPFGEAARVLYEKTAWKDAKNFDGPQDPDLLLKQLIEQTQKRHSQHFAGVHGSYSREIGLSSKRNTRRYRYAPSDQFLKSLVLTTVPHKLEFQRFLQVLYDNYGLVVGHQQAARFIGSGASDKRAFEENAQRLEMRLGSLGLLRRLSDACAYVINPFLEPR